MLLIPMMLELPLDYVGDRDPDGLCRRFRCYCPSSGIWWCDDREDKVIFYEGQNDKVGKIRKPMDLISIDALGRDAGWYTFTKSRTAFFYWCILEGRRISLGYSMFNPYYDKKLPWETSVEETPVFVRQHGCGFAKLIGTTMLSGYVYNVGETDWRTRTVEGVLRTKTHLVWRRVTAIPIIIEDLLAEKRTTCKIKVWQWTFYGLNEAGQRPQTFMDGLGCERKLYHSELSTEPDAMVRLFLYASPASNLKLNL